MSGWIGDAEQLEYYLSLMGADRDEEGKFLIYGKPVVSFMGAGKEVVVPEEAEYSVGGRRCKLAAGLNSTSYGVKVKVYS